MLSPMTMPGHDSLVVAIACAMLAAGSIADAQTVWAGAAAQADVQRFPQDLVPNRLDGVAGGWSAFAGATPARHLAVEVEWTADTIRDARAVALNLEGRLVTIQSTLAHRTRIVSGLTGFAHTAGARTRISYLAGAAWLKVERTFTTDAAEFVLAFPSDRGAPAASTTGDRSVTPVVGIDALVRLSRHVSAFGGARAHAVPVEPEEMSGWSVRIMAGGAWVF